MYCLEISFQIKREMCDEKKDDELRQRITVNKNRIKRI